VGQGTHVPPKIIVDGDDEWNNVNMDDLGYRSEQEGDGDEMADVVN